MIHVEEQQNQIQAPSEQNLCKTAIKHSKVVTIA